MKQKLLNLRALLMVLMMAVGFGHAFAQDVETLVSGSGSGKSDYVIPDGWTQTGTVSGGAYLKFDNGSITSPVFLPHTNLSFTYTVATFGSGTNHPLTVRILDASSNDVLVEETTATPTSTSYISTGSPLSLGDVSVPFKIQLFAPTGKGIRLRNYSITGTPGGGSTSEVTTTTTIDAKGITNTDIYTGTEAGVLAAVVSVKDGDPIDGATVTWSGNNDAVATIDASTGAVTLVGAGTVTFTANYAGVTDQYTYSSDTYELTVTDSAPYSGGDVTFDATVDMGTSPLEKNRVTFTLTSGTLNNGSEYRLYKNSKTTFSLSDDVISQGFVIQKVAFTGVSGNPASGFEEQEGWTTDGDNGTWTGATTSVSFTASNAQVRATQIVVTVGIPSVLVSLTVSGTPTKTGYEAGETLNPEGLVVTGTYDDQSVAEITDGITWTFDPETLTAGMTSCKVTASVGSVTSEAFEVTGLTVTTPKTLTSITVTGTPAEFWKGDDFNHDGMTVTANYDDETSADVTDKAEFSTPDMSTAGEQTVTVTYGEKEASYNINVLTIANTAETAYTTAEAIAIIGAGKDLNSEVYVKGTVSTVSSYNSKYYSITYWLDNDVFQVYSGKGIDGADFESENDIKVGAQVVVKGIIKDYQGTPEFDKNNVLVSYQVPTPTTANMKITAAKWGTFWAPFAVEIPEGVKAYTGEMKGDWIKMNEVEGVIPANTGVVVTSEQLVNADLPAAESNPAELQTCYTGNTTGAIMNVEQGAYLLQKNFVAEKGEEVVGWYKVDGEGFTLAPNRCYLAKGTVTETAAESRTFIGFEPVDGDATGISTIASQAATKADGKYMVKGQIVVVKSGKAYNVNGTQIK